MTEPKLLILDEPVSALDAANRVQVLGSFAGLRSEGIAMLYISHDLGSVAGICDRTAVLYQGRIVEYGPTTEIVNNPQHPYTRLLVGSAPTLHGTPIDRKARAPAPGRADSGGVMSPTLTRGGFRGVRLTTGRPPGRPRSSNGATPTASCPTRASTSSPRPR